MKIFYSLILCSVFTGSINAQIVTIPDANFKAYLVGNSSINTNSDTEIQVSEATAYTGGILASSQGISDLTGIEAFTNATYLDCSFNTLTTINISNCTALTTLHCHSNQLTALNVSSNTNLTDLNCGGNSISSLSVSTNTLLTSLSCHQNQLTSLDVSTNVNLTSLSFFSNSVTSINLSSNTALTSLGCSSNSLTALDLSNNNAITTLTCAFNSITSLDLSNMSGLTSMECNYNSLTSLNVANGNNSNLTLFNAQVNPDLTCIQVDPDIDVVNPPANMFKDATASFSHNCVVNVNDINDQSYSVFYNAESNQLNLSFTNIQANASLEIYSLNGQLLKKEQLIDVSNEKINLDLAVGTYLIKMTVNGEVLADKLIVQN